MTTKNPKSYNSSIPIDIQLPSSALHLLIDRFVNQFISQLDLGTHELYTLELIKQTPIDIVKDGQQFNIQLHLEGLVNGKGLFLKNFSASGEITINLVLQYQFVHKNTLRFEPIIKTYSWIKKPVLNAIGLDINILSITDVLLSKVIKDAQEKINKLEDKNIINLNQLLNSKLQDLTNITIELEGFPIQIDIKQLKIKFSDLVNNNQIYHLKSYVQSDAHILNQNNICPIDLNRDMDIIIGQIINLPQDDTISLPITIGYDLINHLIQSKIKDLKLDVLGKEISIKKASISYHTDQKIKCDIQSDYKMLEHFRLIFQPTINPTSNQLTIHNLEINLIETTFLGKTMLLADNIIINQIYKKINPIELEPIFKEIKSALHQQAILKAKEYDMDLSIKNDAISISKLDIQESHIQFNIDTNLQLSVLLNSLEFNKENIL